MMHHSKALEKFYSMMIFVRSLTGTLPSKKPKNPKHNPETWYVNNSGVLHIVEKVIKRRIRR